MGYSVHIPLTPRERIKVRKFLDNLVAKELIGPATANPDGTAKEDSLFGRYTSDPSQQGRQAQIIRNDRPAQTHGLLVGHCHEGCAIVIPDGLETPSKFHPDFWEPEDPEYRRANPYVRLLDPILDPQHQTMPPGTVVQRVGVEPPIRGTLLAWSYQFGGHPRDTLKIILAQHFEPLEWEPGSIDPRELKTAFEQAIPNQLTPHV